MTTPNPNTDRYYVAEKPCLRGHHLRFKSTGGCVDCTRIRDRNQYAATKGEHPTKPRSVSPKKTPAEAPSGLVELLKPDPETALLLVRQIVLEGCIGPVQDAALITIRRQLQHLNQCRRNEPPPSPSRVPLTRSSRPANSN